MSSNQALSEQQIRHQIALLRRGAGMANEIIPIIERVIDQVSSKIASTPDQLARQRIMLQELQLILAAAYTEVSDATIANAIDLAEYEAEHQVSALGRFASASFAKPALDQITSFVESDPMDLEPGRQMTMRQALERFGSQKSRQITQLVQDGIIQQQTNAEISRAVRDLTSLHKRQADALVRTIASGAAYSSKRRTWEENSDIIKHYRYTATLDSRTRLEHQSLDGSTYETLRDAPRTPHGWNCRCVIVPVVKDEYQIPGFEGERPVKGDDGPGTVSARTTYTGFLKAQSKEFQNEVLGPERAALFRSGEVTLKDMVNQFGEPLTLAELRALGDS